MTVHAEAIHSSFFKPSRSTVEVYCKNIEEMFGDLAVSSLCDEARPYTSSDLKFKIQKLDCGSGKPYLHLWHCYKAF